MENPLQKELNRLAAHLDQEDKRAASVSKAGIYWHVDHCLRILQAVPPAMHKSIKENYRPKRSFTKTLIMTTGYIPRGKARSPKHVTPEKNALDRKAITARLKDTIKQTNKLVDLAESSFMEHPFFGSLQKKQAIKFMKIHTRHHLKIIRDILANQ